MNTINLPKKWSSWEITGEIGKGSSGTVYCMEKTTHNRTKRTALKVIELSASSEKDMMMISVFGQKEIVKNSLAKKVENYKNEIKMMETLRGCKHIVEILDHEILSEEDGLKWTIYIQMEYLQTLPERLASESFSEDEVHRLGRDICDALNACERNGIIHRDIKPANIFWSDKAGYKLGDFGIACLAGESSVNTASTGTLNYMAPEVYHEQSFDQTVDIYALGMILYRILNNGCGPFIAEPEESAKRQTLRKAVTRRMDGEKLPAPVSDSPLTDAVLKACSFDPKDRFQSAARFKAAL